MQEAVVSPLPAGAGRTSDWQFPDAIQMVSTATTPTTIRNRLNNLTLAPLIGSFGGGASVLGVTGGGVGSNNLVNGNTVKMTGSGAGAGQICRFSTGPFVWFNLFKTRVALPPGGMGDYACTSVSMYMNASQMVGVSVQDSGLQVVQAQQMFLNQGQAGFAFIRTGLNAWSFSIQAVTAGARFDNAITNPATFDETVVHKYQMIFQSATNATNATVTAYLDNVPKVTKEWTPTNVGVTMPDMLNAGQLGFCVQSIMGDNGNINMLIPAGIQIISAPTVAMCF